MQKIKIHILHSNKDQSKITWDFLWPLYWCKSDLKSIGYEVKFFSEPNKQFEEADFLWVLSSWLRCEKDHEELLNRAEKALSQHPKSCFFDIGDSAGLLYRRFFSSCKFYVKKQIYKNREHYLGASKDPRRHLQYYMDKYELEGSGRSHKDLHFDKIKKMRLSWNVGVGDYRNFFYRPDKVDRYLHTLQLRYLKSPVSIPGLKEEIIFTSFENREIDLMSLFSSYEKISQALYYHRKETSDVIKKIKSKNIFSILDGFINPTEYYKKLKTTKLALAPFGWGEISWKDFEMFQKGIVLIKPDMVEIDTWPNYYLPQKTYVPYKIDASDLVEVLEACIGNQKEMEEIARVSQKHYLSYQPSINSSPFVTHFDHLLKDMSNSEC